MKGLEFHCILSKAVQNTSMDINTVQHIKTLRIRIKDRHARALLQLGAAVNMDLPTTILALAAQ